MDDSRFDQLTRQLAAGRSRRSVLNALAGGLAAGVASLLGGSAAVAKPYCRGAGHPCEGNQTCCDGLVCAVTGPGKARRCSACPAGQIFCGGACIDACTPSDACHTAGVCDPDTGACTNPEIPGCIPCADNGGCPPPPDACSISTCIAGVCVTAPACDGEEDCCPTSDGVICCTDGEICCGSTCCAPEDCCPGAAPGAGMCFSQAAGDICCGEIPGIGDPVVCYDGEVCTGEGCCDPARACDDICCPAGTTCLSLGPSVCG